MRLVEFACALAVAAPNMALADQACLKDGDTVTMTGSVSRETFPGAPNYESIDDGDEPETYWILTIGSPRCFVADDMETGAPVEAAKALRRFQLVVRADQYKSFSDLPEHQARITGQLFSAISGHHHTKALLEVQNIEPAKK